MDDGPNLHGVDVKFAQSGKNSSVVSHQCRP
jgi:hypothetical protein